MDQPLDKSSAPTEFSARTRAANLDRMRLEAFDLAVIGGGITGAGIALDAVSRGLKVALVERRDFASGTSSRSSKLIHGGLRYLEQFHFSLVRESLHERAALQRMAPHLSRPLRFLVPVYKSVARSPLGNNRLKLAAGLWLYDLLAGRQNVGRHRWLPPGEALKHAPMLNPSGLRGAFLYYDCLTDDARLVIEVIKAAAARGAVIANYTSAGGFSKTNGLITSLQLEDQLEHRSFELKARVFINATGVWADEVSRLSDADSPRKLRPSKGIHIVTPAEKLQNKTAVLIPSLGEQRFLFVIPWQGRTLIGTTDTDYQGQLDAPLAETDEVHHILESASRAFPGADLSDRDVISSFAGLRPLIAAQKKSTKELSREEEIFEDDSGLVTITGGKLTTWRRMAERVVDAGLAKIDGQRNGRSSATEAIQLTGARPEGGSRRAVSDASLEFRVEEATVEHLLETYGGNFRLILEITREDQGLKSVLIDGLPHIEAEVIYAARYEMASSVEDFLSRRTRIELLAYDHGKACAERVATLMARELSRQSDQLEHISQLSIPD